MTSGGGTWTGNECICTPPPFCKPSQKHPGNSSSDTFEAYLFPNQKVLLLGRSAPGVGPHGTRWYECPRKEGVLEQENYGVEEVEGKRSTVLQNHVPPKLKWGRVR